MKHHLTLLVLLSIVIFRLSTVPIVSRGESVNVINSSDKVFSLIRKKLYLDLQKFYPSPHVELLTGTVLGLNALSSVPTFNDILRKSGTIHVVVVSGFNIVLLFNFVENLVGSIYKFRNYLFALIITFVYAVFTGFGYPVIRAWIMSALSFSTKYLGLRASQLHIVMLTGLVMLILSPQTLFELSFQLSFLAVVGLIVVGPVVSSRIEKFYSGKNSLLSDFSTSLAAQCLVWPLLSYNFGTINIIAPFVNAIVLWTIPRITVLGLVAVCIVQSAILSYLLAFAIYPFLDFFVEVVTIFARIPFANIAFKIPLLALLVYYSSLFVLLAVYNRYYAEV